MPRPTREGMPIPDVQIRREKPSRGRMHIADPGLSRGDSMNAVIEAARVIGRPAADIAEGLTKPVHELRTVVFEEVYNAQK